jgi:hypothetical protein
VAIRATISIELLQASVSAAELSHATGIWTDPDSNNRMPKDEIPLSEVLVNVFSKVLEDTATVTEQYASSYTKNNAPELLNLLDDFVKVVSYKRDFTDAFTLDDLSQIDKDFYGNKGNIFAFTDIIGLTHEKNLTDNYTVGDVVENLVAKVFNDNYTFGDTHGTEVLKGLADATVLADIRVTSLEKALVDSLSIPDEYTAAFSLPKEETLSLVESFAKVVSFNRAFNDAFTLDDLSQIDKDFYGNKGNVAFMLDIIGLTYHKDFTNKNQLNLGTLNSGELNDDGSEDDRRVTVSDVVTLALDWVRTFTDSYSFTDTNSYEFIKNVEDAFTLDDTSLINKDFYGDKGNVFGFSDLLGSSFGKTLTDSISQLDEVSILQGLNKSDSTTLSDTYRTTLNKAISDAFTLDDALQVDKDYFGNKGNVFTFSDVLSYEASKDLIDGIALVELVGFVLNHPVEDSYTVTDTNTLQPELVKSDSIGFSDIYIRNIMKGLSDGFALDDTAQVNKDTDSAKGNIFSFSDVFSRTVSYDRDYTDNFGFSDIIGLDQNKVLTDSYTVSDVIEVAMLWVRGFTDTFKVYDENPNALNVNLLNSQAMNAQDTSFLVDRGLDKGDALGFSEITAFVHSKGLTDSAILADTNAILVSKPKTDSFGVSDDSYVSSGVNPSDSISFGDSYERVLSKVLSDAFALDDAALINKNYSGNKGNIFGVSDVFDRSVMYARSFQETVSTSDTNKVIFTAGKSDSVSISDILEFNTEYNRNFTDTAVLDSVSLLALGKAFTDTINSVTDVYAITQMKNPSDTIDFTDSTRATIEKDVIDGIGLDDSTLVNKNYFGNKGNLIGLSELVSLVTTYKRTISDSVALSETLDTAFNKNETENITLNELTAFVHSKGLTDSAIVVDSSSVSLNKSKTDSFGMSDNNVVASGVNPSDSISFSDSHDRTLSKVLSDTFALDDSALINKDFTGSKGNVFGFSDVLSKTVGFNRAFTDAFSFSDDSVRSLNKGINDSSVLNDLLSFSQTKKISEILTFNDDYGVQLEKTLSDSFTLDDSALVNKDYFGNKGNIMSLSDLVAVNLIRSNQLGTRNFNTMLLN